MRLTRSKRGAVRARRPTTLLEEARAAVASSASSSWTGPAGPAGAVTLTLLTDDVPGPHEQTEASYLYNLRMTPAEARELAKKLQEKAEDAEAMARNFEAASRG